MYLCVCVYIYAYSFFSYIQIEIIELYKAVFHGNRKLKFELAVPASLNFADIRNYVNFYGFLLSFYVLFLYVFRLVWEFFFFVMQCALLGAVLVFLLGFGKDF